MKWRDQTLRTLAALLLAAIAIGPTWDARAADIAALVEEVSDPTSELAPMDVLETGRVVKLAAGAKLVLGYLKSCVRETITGGTLTIGDLKSTVVGGKRVEDEVDCDGGRIVQTSGNSSDVAGAVFRKGKKDGKPLPKPGWTLFGISPLVKLTEPTKRLRIERLDGLEAGPIDISVVGKLVDLASKNVRLEAGGLYLFSNDRASYVVKISPLAESDAPVLSRYLPL